MNEFPRPEESRPEFGRPENPFQQESRPEFGRTENPFQEEPRPEFGRPESRFQEEPRPEFGRPENPFQEERRPEFGRPANRFQEEPRPEFGRPEEGPRNQFARRNQQEEGRIYKESATDAIAMNEVDTFDKEATGNWLLKRVWWEKIEEVYELIKKTFNDIMNVRMSFVSQRNRLDRELDIFYGQMGLEEGPLSELIDHGLQLLKQEKNSQQGLLNKEQEKFLAIVQGKERDLEQLKLNIKALQELDKKLDQALDTLFQQIDIANQYEQKAWETFKEVARELDDKAARKSYYETEGLLKDIKNIHSYLTGEFSNYFSQAIQSSQSHSEMITSQMQALKNSGVDLKKIAEELEQAQKAEEAEKKAAEVKIELQNKVKKEKIEEASKPHGFIQKTIASVKSVFLNVADRVITFGLSLLNRVQGLFIKEQKNVEKNLSKETKKIDTAEEKEFKAVDDVLKKNQELIEHQEKHFPEEHDTEMTEHHTGPFSHHEEPVKHSSFGEHPFGQRPQEAFGHRGAFEPHEEFGQKPESETKNPFDFGHERESGSRAEERPFEPRSERQEHPFGEPLHKEEARPVSVMPFQEEERFGAREERFHSEDNHSVSPFHRP